MIEKFLYAWTAFVIRRAAWVLFALACITLVAGIYALTTFKMNSNTAQLIRQETDWRRIHNEFIDIFPQYDQNAFVVVSGQKPDLVRQVARALGDEISASETFRTVYAPGVSSFAEKYTLLFVDTEDLDSLVSKLADAQPFLAAVARDHSLRGVIDLLQDAVSEALTGEEELPAGLGQVADSLSRAIAQASRGEATPISWRDELFQPSEDDTYYQLVFVQGRQDFGVQLPNQQIMAGIKGALARLEHPFRDEVDIRVTGQVPLEHSEIESAVESASLAGTLALFVLACVLILGVRSAKIIAATYLAMATGMIWTAALAMLVVGQFNTISIIFLVMFIGLGVDFALHLCLRFQEAAADESREEAILDMATSLGPAIILCGITSAIGFLSFAPTNYTGLAEMGIISGGGMIVAVIISLTLIPALFAVLKLPRPSAGLPFGHALANQLRVHPRGIAYGTLGLAAVLAIIAAQSRFDYSTLAIKNPESVAMTTLRELIEEEMITDYALYYVADDLEAAKRIKPVLEALDSVSTVTTPEDYLPSDQQDKLYLLDDAAFLLAGTFNSLLNTEPLPDGELVKMLTGLTQDLQTYLSAHQVEPGLSASLAELALSLRGLAADSPAARQLLTELVLPPLRKELSWLQEALAVMPIALQDLPQETQARLLTNDGRALVAITPAEDVVPVDALRRFTTEVLGVVPEVTGRPVLDLGIGELVMDAFTLAISIAVTLIFIILLITLRSIVDTLLVFIPLSMTALLTLAVSVVIDLPLNMANIVVIPLIFGLGIDNGIHMVQRFRHSHTVEELVKSSTPKAVFLSNLTTLSTFSTLLVSSHQGIYSIGVLLAVGISGLMLLTLISLPALLQTFSTGPHLSPD